MPERMGPSMARSDGKNGVSFINREREITNITGGIYTVILDKKPALIHLI